LKRQDSISDDSSFFGRLKKNKSIKQKRGTFVGTALYAAPEMLESNQSGFYTDLWALGCIIYEMCTGLKLFQARNNKEIFDKIIKIDLEFPSYMDKNAIDLVKKLCKAEPHERIGYTNFKALKQHKFFKNLDWDALSKQVYPVPEGVPTVNWTPQVYSENSS
jgi:3-phosphoinositide dependent protein kinase-1